MTVMGITMETLLPSYMPDGGQAALEALGVVFPSAPETNFTPAFTAAILPSGWKKQRTCEIVSFIPGSSFEKRAILNAAGNIVAFTFVRFYHERRAWLSMA